jgi:hypothetical protein
MQVTKAKKKKKQCCCTCRLSLTYLRKSFNANPCRNFCLQGKLAFPHKVLSLLASPQVPSPSSSSNTRQDKRHFDLSLSLSYTHTPHLFCSLAAIHVSLLHVGASYVEHVWKVTFFHFLQHFLHTPRPLPQRHVGTSYARLIRQQRRHTHTHRVAIIFRATTLVCTGRRIWLFCVSVTCETPRERDRPLRIQSFWRIVVLASAC